MKRTVDHYLNRIRAYDPITEQQHAAITARVRRDVLARFGEFPVVRRDAVHTSEVADNGMLLFLRAMRSFHGVGRPAFALAAMGVLVVGVVTVMQRMDGVVPNASTTRSASVVARR